MQAQLTRNSIGSSHRTAGAGAMRKRLPGQSTTSLVRIPFASSSYSIPRRSANVYSSNDKAEAEVEESNNNDKTPSSTVSPEQQQTVNQFKEEEEPVWVRRERERELQEKEGKDLPFGVYLIGSALVAIAAVGSVFEYANKNPIFDVIYPDSALYAPILGVFALTGLPSAGFLFYKAVTAANKEAERMDKLDGY